MSSSAPASQSLSLVLREVKSKDVVMEVPLVDWYLSVGSNQPGFIKAWIQSGCQAPSALTLETIRSAGARDDEAVIVPHLQNVTSIPLCASRWSKGRMWSANRGQFHCNVELVLPESGHFATFSARKAGVIGDRWVLESTDGQIWLSAEPIGRGKKPQLYPTLLIFSQEAWNSPAWQSLIQRVGKIVLDEERTKLETIHEEATKRVRESEAQLEEHAAKRRKIGLA